MTTVPTLPQTATFDRRSWLIDGDDADYAIRVEWTDHGGALIVREAEARLTAWRDDAGDEWARSEAVRRHGAHLVTLRERLVANTFGGDDLASALGWFG